ncbi:MAG: type II toxin-antitoxin system HipA family toxin [Kiritimatiellae bacterium]|nr:type II toxin-antitoxin system HipA family toxin [Kiritimatiellia bacterium]
MTRLVHVGKIRVFLWGRRVGSLVAAPQPGVYAFRFEREFLLSGIEISPLMMPLRREPYVFPDLPQSAYSGLPPVFADSLPDSFGRGLVDYWLVEHGIDRSEITPLDELAYIGSRGMGALTYEPDWSPGRRPTAIDIRTLAESARRVVNGELRSRDRDDALRMIIRLGSSAGGAQAKAVVGWNRTEDRFLIGDRDLPSGYEHWIVKFTPQKYPWRGEREFKHHERARAVGIRMSESRLCEVDGIKHFMTKRFDREGGCRHHLLSLSGMAHLPAETPPEHRRYEQLFIAADSLHLPYEDREEIFRRMTFNVLSGEFDDHPKNFSFILKEGEGWRLAPAYDLTGADYPSTDPWSTHAGTHNMSVNGRFSDISKEDLLTVADRFGIGTAKDVFSKCLLSCTTGG